MSWRWKLCLLWTGYTVLVLCVVLAGPEGWAALPSVLLLIVTGVFAAAAAHEIERCR